MKIFDVTVLENKEDKFKERHWLTNQYLVNQQGYKYFFLNISMFSFRKFTALMHDFSKAIMRKPCAEQQNKPPNVEQKQIYLIRRLQHGLACRHIRQAYTDMSGLINIWKGIFIITLIWILWRDNLFEQKNKSKKD